MNVIIVPCNRKLWGLQSELIFSNAGKFHEKAPVTIHMLLPENLQEKNLN